MHITCKVQFLKKLSSEDHFIIFCVRRGESLWFQNTPWFQKLFFCCLIINNMDLNIYSCLFQGVLCNNCKSSSSLLVIGTLFVLFSNLANFMPYRCIIGLAFFALLFFSFFHPVVYSNKSWFFKMSISTTLFVLIKNLFNLTRGLWLLKWHVSFNWFNWLKWFFWLLFDATFNQLWQKMNTF
jgi:hypothetical protein